MEPGELLAEAVLGLGETLVGNYPGRSMSVIFEKQTRKQSILSYPGKSVALYGSGLIFRSDSNGEDLTDYAGAGLYDSVLLHPPREVLLELAVRTPDQARMLVEDEARRARSALVDCQYHRPGTYLPDRRRDR